MHANGVVINFVRGIKYFRRVQIFQEKVDPWGGPNILLHASVFCFSIIAQILTALSALPVRANTEDSYRACIQGAYHEPWELIGLDTHTCRISHMPDGLWLS